MLMRLEIDNGCLSVCYKIVISLPAERRRREARREKFTHENCTLSTIYLGQPGPSDDDDDVSLEEGHGGDGGVVF